MKPKTPKNNETTPSQSSQPASPTPLTDTRTVYEGGFK